MTGTATSSPRAGCSAPSIAAAPNDSSCSPPVVAHIEGDESWTARSPYDLTITAADLVR